MADRNFSALYDYVMPYLPGAEQGIVDFHIRRVLREFLKRTTIWRQTFEFNTAPEVETGAYQLSPGAGRQVSSILSVHWGGNRTRLPVLPESARDPNWAPGSPRGWYSLIPSVLVLAPRPTSVFPVVVEAALTIQIEEFVESQTTGTSEYVPWTVFPGEVFEEHAEALAAGVISGMMLMPGKPWTKLDSGASYGRIFGAAIRDTRGKLRDGGQPNASTFTGPRFGV